MVRRVVPVDQAAIDEAVFCECREEKPALDAAANRAVVHMFGYQLLAAEFASVCATDRDHATRRAIRRIVLGHAGAVRAGLAPELDTPLGRELAEVVPDPEDFALLAGIIGSSHGSAGFARALDETVFGFDATTMRRLAELSPARAIAEVRALLRPHVIEGVPGAVANVFVACAGPGGDPAQPQCRNGRLQISADDFEAFVPLLAADAADPARRHRIREAGVIFFEAFEHRPGEILTLRR